MISGQPVDARPVAAALGGRSVVLVGMMGAGKTSVGKRLAAKLGLPFVDADAEIEAGAQLTIPEIFERFGEAYFREGERKVIARLLNAGPQGAGDRRRRFHERSRRATRIAAHGVSIWLKPDFEVLLARVRKKSNRPLLQTADPEETLRRLLDERSPTYALADITIESRDGPHDVGGRNGPATPRRSAVRAGCSRRRASRRKVEVPLGAARILDPHRPRPDRRGGGRNREDRARRKMRDRHRRQCRAALSRARLTASLDKRGPALAARSSARPAKRQSPTPNSRAFRDALIDARIERRDIVDRARRRRHRRSRRLLRGFASPRRPLRADPDDAAVAGRFQRRRQDGDQFAARQEPRRRVPSALAGAGRLGAPRHAERARVSRRLRRGRQIRPDRRPASSSNFSKLAGARCFRAAPRGPRRSR